MAQQAHDQRVVVEPDDVAVLAADPERLEATKRLRRAIGRDFPDDATFSRELDEAKRVIPRIRPDRVLGGE